MTQEDKKTAPAQENVPLLVNDESEEDDDDDEVAQDEITADTAGVEMVRTSSRRLKSKRLASEKTADLLELGDDITDRNKPSTIKGATLIHEDVYTDLPAAKEDSTV